MSPGWQSRYSQIFSSVSKRTPFTLPCLSSDRFASVMPTCWASSFDFTLRSASTTSSLTTMGMDPAPSSDELRVLFSKRDRFRHDVRDLPDDAGEVQREETARAERHADAELLLREREQDAEEWLREPARDRPQRDARREPPEAPDDAQREVVAVSEALEAAMCAHEGVRHERDRHEADHDDEDALNRGEGRSRRARGRCGQPESLREQLGLEGEQRERQHRQDDGEREAQRGQRGAQPFGRPSDGTRSGGAGHGRSPLDFESNQNYRRT